MSQDDNMDLNPGEMEEYCADKEEAMNLTENQKRLLTEFLGECWHEYIKQPPLEKWEIDQGYIQTALCSCGSHSCLKSNRTFTTYQDLGDVKDKLVEKGLWRKFWWFSFEKESKARKLASGEVFSFSEWDAWLFRPTDESGNPHFCRLVSLFLEETK